VVVGGIGYWVQVAHLKLCAGRAFCMVAYSDQGHEMMFDAHTRSLTALGGIARRGIYECKELLAVPRPWHFPIDDSVRGSAGEPAIAVRKRRAMLATTVGTALAKNVFAVQGIGETGLTEVRRAEVRHTKLLEFVAAWSPAPSAWQHFPVPTDGLENFGYWVQRQADGANYGPLSGPAVLKVHLYTRRPRTLYLRSFRPFRG
jgi:hypothetical protein